MQVQQSKQRAMPQRDGDWINEVSDPIWAPKQPMSPAIAAAAAAGYANISHVSGSSGSSSSGDKHGDGLQVQRDVDGGNQHPYNQLVQDYSEMMAGINNSYVNPMHSGAAARFV